MVQYIAPQTREDALEELPLKRLKTQQVVEDLAGENAALQTRKFLFRMEPHRGTPALH